MSAEAPILRYYKVLLLDCIHWTYPNRVFISPGPNLSCDSQPDADVSEKVAGDSLPQQSATFLTNLFIIVIISS